MKFADPTNDVAFKKIFGSEGKKIILISFLNAILDFRGEREIEEVEIANPYQVPKIEELKNTLLDIKARARNGEHFIVEMQVEKDIAFAKRSLYYTAKSYVEQLDGGEHYHQLNKVYFIGILNFSIFRNDSYLSRHLILDKETLKQEIKDFEFAFIELPKFRRKIDELQDDAQRWIYFIRNASGIEMIPEEFENKEAFLEAFAIAEQFRWNKKEMEVYDYVRIREMRRESEMRTARLEGEEEGVRKGIQQGIQEGIQQGIQEGIRQGILGMHAIGAAEDVIAGHFGISTEEVQRVIHGAGR